MSYRPPADSTAQQRQAEAKLTAHRGMATWGERLVTLDRYRRATAAAGRRLSAAERLAERQRFLAPGEDPTPVEGPFGRIAVFGGVYSNHLALVALLADAARRGAEAIYCLGDLGGFGPKPDKVWPLLEHGLQLRLHRPP
jgi:hypothetical protein